MLSINSRMRLAGAAALLLISACNSEQAATAPAAKDTAEATVNGVAINKSRIDMLAKQSGTQADNAEARKAIIDKLSMQMVVAEEAVKKGLDKSPEVTGQLELVKQSVLANAYVRDFLKANPVSDEMLKAEYERIKSTATGTEYKARHILVEKESEAREIIARLKKEPGSFAKLASEKSRDAGSKADGGELGWFDASRMVPEFSAAVAKLEKGATTQEPVKSQFGYHVIQLEDSKPIEAPPIDDVKPQLTQQIQQQNLKKQLDDLKSKAKIVIVEAPPTPAAVPAPAAAAAAPAPAPTPAPAAAPAK